MSRKVLNVVSKTKDLDHRTMYCTFIIFSKELLCVYLEAFPCITPNQLNHCSLVIPPINRIVFLLTRFPGLQ